MFVLDYMHLLCLGIMKRLLVFYWVPRMKKSRGVSLSSDKIKLLSNLLENLRSFIPAEFQRAPRGLLDLAIFKATEFSFFFIIQWTNCFEKSITKISVQTFPHFAHSIPNPMQSYSL